MSASPGRRRADLTPRPYRLLRDDIAPKLSGRSGAAVAFLLLADLPDTPAPDLFVAVTANVGGGGLWSKEAVPLAAVATAIDTWLSAQPASDSGATPADAPRPFPTRALAAAYAGRSNNNAPFLAACLRHLGLLAAAPDTPHHHVLAANLDAFRQHGLAQAGEPTTYPPAPEPHRHADPD